MIPIPESSSPENGMLHLSVGDMEFTLPVQNALHVTVSPPLAPLPLASRPMEGMAIVNDLPVVQVDVSHALTGQPGTGRSVVVVFHEHRQVALRVDRVSTHDGRVPTSPPCSGPSPSLMPNLSLFLKPLAPPAVPATTGLDAQAKTLPLQLLLVRRRGRTVGIPAVSIEHVGRIESCSEMLTESGHTWKLVRLNGEVLPACPAPSRLVGEQEEDEANWGMIVTPRGDRLVWTASSVLGFYRLAHESIRRIKVPDDTPTLCFDTEEGVLVEIVDPGGVFNSFSAASQTRKESAWKFHCDLHLRCGPFRCLLPLDTVGCVLETVNGLSKKRTSSADLPVVHGTQLLGCNDEARPRRGVVVNLWGGQRMVLAVDEVGTAPAALVAKLQLLPAVPEPVSQLFDGVIWDRTSEEWIYRFRHLTADSLSSHDRLFGAGHLGWLPAENVQAMNTALA